jgi:hypothetical protein
MNSSVFDADSFLQQTVDEPFTTEFVMVPPGEYLAAIDDFDRDALQQVDFEYKKGPKAGQPGTMTKLTIPFIINDDKVKQELERDKVVVSKQVILDLDDNGQLASGKNKNIELGRLRDALGQNDDDTWSIAKLRGAGPLMVRVTHIEYDRRDGTKGKRAEIDRIARVR